MRKVSTSENLNEPQPLPDVWGGVFGLFGIKEKIGDLSWTLDPELQDVGWFETDIPEPSNDIVVEEDIAVIVWNNAKKLLTESDWAMLPDVPMTKGDRIKWEDYRRALREIKLQPRFPNEVNWPTMPK